MAVRPMIDFVRTACLFCLAPLLSGISFVEAAATTPATLLVKDALMTLGQPAVVEAGLYANGLLSAVGLVGEPLELIVDGKVVATGMTGGDGRAFLSYQTKTLGLIPIQVRVGSSSRVVSTEGQANLVAWERRDPIIAIEVAALMDKQAAEKPLPGIGLTFESERTPMPDAAAELVKLTQYYYRVIYVATAPSSNAERLHLYVEVRAWLNAHKFPPGYLVMVQPGESGWGAMIDELYAGGWKNLKTGIGRSKAFTDAFLQRRLDAVAISDSAAGGVSRKAKVAKDWKEVRKKL
jgi:hypothetical protein